MQSKRISRADLVAVVAGISLLSTLVFAQLDPSRELANRSTCAANLRGITQSMNVYAADGDTYPLLTLPASATHYDVTFKEDAGSRNAETALDSLYTDKKYPDNPSAGLWLMVLNGQVVAKQFICKSDPVPTPAFVTNSDGGNYLNFQSPRNFSYSSAYPWTERNGKVGMSGLWHNDTDSTLPLISDMAPYFGRTAANNPSPSPDSSSEKWALTKANSTNHQLDGQNIGFGDGHVEFQRMPNAGQNNDSIWGIRKRADGPDQAEQFIAAGTLPHPPGGSRGAWDVIMVPTRDEAGNVK